MAERRCTKCKSLKVESEDNFHKDTRYGKKGFATVCKDCIHKRQKEVYYARKDDMLWSILDYRNRK